MIHRLMKRGTLLAVMLLLLPHPSPGKDAVPVRAARYRAQLTREARAAWGLSAPVALLAAQLHQESAWREAALSSAGAEGLAQFMPLTADWLARLYPKDLGPARPLDPRWALRALVTYDALLEKQMALFQRGDERWAATLASYNGGAGWIRREARDLPPACRAQPDLTWFSCVEARCLRSAASCRENREYPRRILFRYRPLYQAAGW